MFGFYNRILWIDASNKTFSVESISDDLLKKTLGGKGLGTHLLLTHNKPNIDPLGPDNHMILTTGPIAGTSVWGSCRHGIFTLSPQTGFYSESYSGGSVAEDMARTGFDAVVVKGASDKPIWLEVTDSEVIFHSAEEWWGCDSFQTEDKVKEWMREERPAVKKKGVICIGPAGENLVTFSVINNDYWRSLGRTGAGAVMGSKKIKAMVFSGNREKVVADPEGLREFTRQFAKIAKDDAGVKNYKLMGTSMLVDIMNNVGGFPTRYWQKGVTEHKDRINAAALHDKIDVKPHACNRCFIACGRLGEVKDGPYKGLKLEGPEYETIYSFGGLCEVSSIEEIAYLNDICDRLGFDTMTAGNLTAFTIEAVKKGRATYDIDYGETEKIAVLLHDISARKGIGDLLSRGIRAAAKEWNLEDFAIHVKGLEPAGYDPRVLKGMGLAYGTSDRGACHLRTTFYKPELSKIIDPDQIEGKAKMLIEWEDRLTIFDTLIVCRFFRDLYQWDHLQTMIRVVTGLEFTKDDLRHIAALVSDNARQFNCREGLQVSDDLLPKRFHEEPLPETGKVISEKDMGKMLSDYYLEKNWQDKGLL